jgi:hypothetical protein
LTAARDSTRALRTTAHHRPDDSHVYPKDTSVNTLLAYDRAHDEAQRLARRHERDLHWAKERRRQQEREIAEAAALLAVPASTLARRTLVVSVVLLVMTGAGFDFALTAGLSSGWLLLAGAAAVAIVLTVAICASVSLLGIRSRRAAARIALHSRDARLSHTQYHIHESVHSFIDSHVEVVNTRPATVA